MICNVLPFLYQFQRLLKRRLNIISHVALSECYEPREVHMYTGIDTKYSVY